MFPSEARSFVSFSYEMCYCLSERRDACGAEVRQRSKGGVVLDKGEGQAWCWSEALG